MRQGGVRAAGTREEAGDTLRVGADRRRFTAAGCGKDRRARETGQAVIAIDAVIVGRQRLVVGLVGRVAEAATFALGGGAATEAHREELGQLTVVAGEAGGTFAAREAGFAGDAWKVAVFIEMAAQVAGTRCGIADLASAWTSQAGAGWAAPEAAVLAVVFCRGGAFIAGPASAWGRLRVARGEEQHPRERPPGDHAVGRRDKLAAVRGWASSVKVGISALRGRAP